MPHPTLTLDRLSYTAPDGRTLFEDLSLSTGPSRLAVIGRNGTGKSSLLNILTGRLPPASGSLSLSGRIGLLAQDSGDPGVQSVGELMGVTADLARLARIEAGAPEPEDLDLADWALPARLSEALDQMDLSGLPLDHPAASLSGGERTRARLAGLLGLETDILLLNEPTNHLDARGRAQVADALEAHRGCVVLVSHDRALLRRCDRFLELSGLAPRLFTGDYDAFRALRAEEAQAALSDLEAARRDLRQVERQARAEIEKAARRARPGKEARRRREPKILLNAVRNWAENSASRRSRTSSQLEDSAKAALSEADARVERLNLLAFDLPPTGLPAGRRVLEMQGAGFHWPEGPSVLEGLDLTITGPERIGLTGPNGSGKSTLLNLASGELAPTSGQVRLSVAVARLDQDAALPEGSVSLVDAFRRRNPLASENRARAALATFLFRNSAADKPPGALSGGERLRAALACLLLGDDPPSLLVLDEPTNALDLDSLEALEAALRGFDGALLVASHDEDFLDALGLTRRLRLGGQVSEMK